LELHDMLQFMTNEPQSRLVSSRVENRGINIDRVAKRKACGSYAAKCSRTPLDNGRDTSLDINKVGVQCRKISRIKRSRALGKRR
jgi:hypothetical protein